MESGKLNLGVIGCGEVTRAKHLPALARLNNISITAVCDINPEACARVAEEFHIRGRFHEPRALLASRDIDAVGICVPPGHHAEIAIAALHAGKHVWIDKPLALNAADARRIIAAAAETGLIAMTGFHIRFHRLVREAREIIRAGELGTLESARIVWHSPRGDRNIPRWKTLRAEGGGALTEIAVHQFDLLRFLFDTEIEEIAAISVNGVRDDECSIIAARMSNGIAVSGEFSERSAHEIEIVVSGHDRQLRIDCLRFDGLEVRGTHEPSGSPGLRLRAAAHFARTLPYGIRTLSRGGDYRISYEAAWTHFADAILGKSAIESTLEDGLRAVHAVCAAVESSATGNRVTVEPTAGNAVALGAGATGRPIFSVVVPTFNRPDQLRGLLQALAEQDFPKQQFEVVVVDDGGSLPVDAIVSAYAARLRTTLLTRPNGGCAAARQTGIDAAEGTFLAFTDDDCRPARDWLSRMHRHFSARPQCALSGPTLNEQPANAYCEASQIVVNSLCLAGRDPEGFVRFAPTSNLAFRAAEFRQIGGLQRTWRLAGGEDRDLCARWRYAGFQIFFDAHTKVRHRQVLSASGLWKQHFHYGRGAWLFHRSARPFVARASRAYERFGFYTALLLTPFRKHHTCGRVRLMFALLLSQTATAAGFLAEGLLQANQYLRLRRMAA